VIPGLTTKQIQRLMSLIKPIKVESDKLTGKNVWMLDSRAPAHMMGDPTLLSEIIAMAPVVIDLPNGAQTCSNK